MAYENFIPIVMYRSMVRFKNLWTRITSMSHMSQHRCSPGSAYKLCMQSPKLLRCVLSDGLCSICWPASYSKARKSTEWLTATKWKELPWPVSLLSTLLAWGYDFKGRLGSLTISYYMRFRIVRFLRFMTLLFLWQHVPSRGHASSPWRIS